MLRTDNSHDFFDLSAEHLSLFTVTTFRANIEQQGEPRLRPWNETSGNVLPTPKIK